MHKVMKIAASAALVMLPSLGSAQDQGDGGEHHHWPRAEAIAACKDKTEGDACEFDAPRGHVVGTCHTVRSGDLACVRPHHPH
jgi:hypothetical protein